MIKAYLDTNVLIGLKTERSREFSRLKKLLHDLKDRIYCFYSIAHLHDLKNDRTGQFDEDLIFFESIVDDNFLVREWGKYNADYNLWSPKTAFENYEDDFNWMSSINFEELELLGDLSQDQKNLITSLMNQKLNLDILKNSGENKEIDQFMTLYFGELKNEYSAKEIVIQFMKFYKSLFDDPKNYKNLRRSILEQLPLSQKWDININNLDFSEKLQNTPLAKNFFQFVKDAMHNKEDDPNFSHDFFTNAYFNLNVLGIDGEKNKGIKFSNTLYDSFHSYYSAHCHFLVTNDQGLLTKSKVLFKFYGIDTKPIKVIDFINMFKLEQTAPLTNGAMFLESIKFHAKNGLIQREVKSIKYKRTSKEIKLNIWLLDYFNKMDVIEDEDEGDFLVLFNDFRYFWRIETWKDFSSVTNKLVEFFGPDKKFRSNFNDIDKDEINNGNWSGRTWEIGEATIYLEVNHGTNLFSFVVKL